MSWPPTSSGIRARSCRRSRSTVRTTCGGTPTNGGHVNGPDVIGVFGCSGSASASCGTYTLTRFGTSAAPPPCPVFQCYPDYYDATPSVAADSAGHIVVAYTFSTVAGGPKSLYVAISGDGLTWSA